ncbi:VanZ family protein [Cohnella luojiensis]|uniref:VanZ family protein n=1 Tax=Cohnella luojiensis TaxID=652876 RepID=A0A4Y8LZT4_9BACL|nr:VanZ family protein [Cohnella luojiensis]TFE27270.1 VanZ family protein [Cohnella luojiensis]
MKKWPWICAAVLLCALIFYFTQSDNFTNGSTIRKLSTIMEEPKDDVKVFNMVLRKGAHFFLFGTLAILLKIIFYKHKRSYLVAWFGATLYGVGDEIHQLFVPARGASIFDVMIDSSGACLGLIIFFSINRHYKRALQSENT